VVNAGLVLLASLIVPGFAVHGFLNALIFSVVISLINGLFNAVPKA
jgi:putative membrane protein